MERILDFLMSNIYFVIIVIGLIYTMFFRKSPLERPPQQRPHHRPPSRPTNRMPDFGGSPVFPPKPQRPPASADTMPRDRGGSLPVERREPRPEFAGPPPVERREPRPEFAWPPPVKEPGSEWAGPPPVNEPHPVYAGARPVVSVDSRPESTGSFAASYLAQSSGPGRQSMPIRDIPESATDSQYGAAETRIPLSRDELTRAVLWAEILGPPRARRPFRR